MKRILLLAMMCLTLAAYPQDTLKIMHYNFLNYGNYTSYCTTENNNHEEKDNYLRTIIGFELPDILTVNEINSYEYYHNRILNSVLNTDGRDYYVKGPESNSALSDIVNMFYYNSEKFGLRSHVVIQNYLRDIDLYTLYCKTQESARSDTVYLFDTVYLNCIVAHLKAGSSNSDATERALMTANVIDYLSDYKQPGNYLFMGDLNTYSSYEECYQNLTGTSAFDFRFYDPVNSPGDWNNNSDFAPVHTQSVTSYSNSCQASGGSDDRFDHILATEQIINGTRGLKYISGSYHAVGQDGEHFNRSINDLPANTTVPADVLDALFRNSDHLPVRLNLLFSAGGTWGIAEQNQFTNSGIYLQSPEIASIFISSPTETNATISIVSITGQVIRTDNSHLQKGRNEINLNISELKPGVYIIRLADLQGRMATIKLVK